MAKTTRKKAEQEQKTPTNPLNWGPCFISGCTEAAIGMSLNPIGRLPSGREVCVPTCLKHLSIYPPSPEALPKSPPEKVQQIKQALLSARDALVVARERSIVSMDATLRAMEADCKARGAIMAYDRLMAEYLGCDGCIHATTNAEFLLPCAKNQMEEDAIMHKFISNGKCSRRVVRGP